MKIGSGNKQVQANHAYLQNVAKSLTGTEKRPASVRVQDHVILSDAQNETVGKKLSPIEFVRQHEAEMEEMRRQAEESKKRMENMKKTNDAVITCMKIAARVIKGDKVPRKDMEYLIQNNPKLYVQAILMREKKEDPEEWDSLVEDEAEGTPQLGESAAVSESGETGDTEESV